MTDETKALAMVLDAVSHAAKAVPDRVTRDVLERAVAKGRAALARVDERSAVEWTTDGSRSMGRMGERTAFVRLDEVSCPSSPWRWRIVQGDGDDVFASGWEASETDAKAAAERAAGLRPAEGGE